MTRRATEIISEGARVVDATGPPEAPGPAVERLLWGWPELLSATGIPRRTIEREIAAGRFPKPIRRVGRRPFFRPIDIIQWSEGSGP
jgi:predicted DNA-binding transcriptional regulator AlpA